MSQPVWLASQTGMNLFRLTLVMGLVAGAKAWACSGLTCESVVVPVPTAGTKIPSNAPAVGVQQTVFSDVAVDGGIEYRPASTLPLVLRGPDGGVVMGQGVEQTHGVFVATTLIEGPWSMSLDVGCPVDAGFTVGPPAPLPAVAATVLLVETNWLPQSAASTCTGPTPARQLVRLRIEPSAEMTPWLPLARWEVEVNGTNRRTFGFGSFGLQSFPFDGFDVQCGGPQDARYLQPGRHEVKVRARILGVNEPIESGVVEVDVTCAPPASGCSAVAGFEVFALLLVWMRRRHFTGRSS